MSALIRLSNWPFDANEKVTLWWLRSPWRESIHRQWRITAVFKTTSGDLEEVDYPWGLLPWLRLGQVFQDGQPIWQETAGRIYNFNLRRSATAVLAESSTINGLAGQLVHGEQNLAEYCLRFRGQDGITIIIPVLECIRAFLVPNKVLASGLLEPKYFERVVGRNVIFDNTLHLHFSNDMPKRIVSRPLASRIARLMHDASFRAAWEHVYHDRFSRAGQFLWNTSVPLTTCLPDLSRSWSIRATLANKILLVHQIMEVKPANLLPFMKIEYRHPRLKKREYSKKSKKKSQKKPEDIKEFSVEGEAEPPSLLTAIRRLPPIDSTLVENFKLKVTQVGVRASQAAKQPSAGKDKDEQMPKSPQQQSTVVNLSDRGVGGHTPEAEFAMQSGQEIFVSQDDGLDDFAEAIQLIGMLYYDIVAIWDVRELERNIPFARVDEQIRKFALVQLKSISGKNTWILEFGRPDDYPISTLLFSFKKETSPLSFEAIIAIILAEALLPQGGWDRRPLKNMRAMGTGFKFAWARHTNCTVEDWAERLYKKSKVILA